MKFDPYEYIGVIIPGSVLILALTLIFPQLVPNFTSSLSLGDLGLMVIFAFIAGHFVQAGGNLWETLVWKVLGGMPKNTALKTNSALLNEDQKTRLKAKLSDDFGGQTTEEFAAGRGAIGELVIHIQQHGNIIRIETFNRTYGLMRGTAVAFFISAALVLRYLNEQVEIAVLLCSVGIVFTYRMVRFGQHYAREIFAEYLRAPAVDQNN